jgi:hypothetical protein
MPSEESLNQRIILLVQKHTQQLATEVSAVFQHHMTHAFAGELGGKWKIPKGNPGIAMAADPSYRKERTQAQIEASRKNAATARVARMKKRAAAEKLVRAHQKELVVRKAQKTPKKTPKAKEAAAA